MIKNILDLLKIAKGESENIKIAKGKYQLATNLKSAYKQIKNEIQWRK
tara:strand:+ start:1146 stop:1289 length:144 start_codon:yes stop_codon:yes gene_type:complete